MINKFFIFLFFTINLLVNLHADEKQLIVDRLIYIDNITFSFEHLTNDKKEVGTCILVFDNKLICDYENSMKKRILINNKTLVVQKKKYNKNYFYPISNSPFIKIFNKEKLINLIKISDYKLKNNIELTYVDENNNKIKVFFDNNNYYLIGWNVRDQLQNEINFSLKITFINSKFDPKLFRIPRLY